MVLILGSLSSISSFLKNEKERLMLSLRPWGGSLVSLMDFSSRPMGISLEGSEVRNRRKLGFEPSSAN
jgi:hypothetical protein